MASPLASTSRLVLPAVRASRSFTSSAAAASHVGSQPVAVPSTVTFTLPPSSSSSSNIISEPILIKGPLGSLQVPTHPFLRLSPSAAKDSLTVAVANPSEKSQKAIWGLTRALLANAVHGVSTGYTLPIRLVGVGYRAALEAKGRELHLKLGYAHPVVVAIPEGLDCELKGTTEILVKGIDKQKVGEFAARVRRWRVPEPYNGKGIFVGDEKVVRKEVKKK